MEDLHDKDDIFQTNIKEVTDVAGKVRPSWKNFAWFHLNCRAPPQDHLRRIWFLFYRRQQATPIFDSALLLVEPNVAEKYAVQMEKDQVVLESIKIGETAQTDGTSAPLTPTNAKTMVLKKRFYGTIELDPVRAKLDFARVAEEIIQNFNLKSDTRVKVSVEIQAESTNGFDEKIQRTVRENSNVLHFKIAEFENE